jgi:hypothetical protein
VFVVYAKRPSLVVTTQHAAVCVSGANGVMVVSAPTSETPYDDSPLPPGALPTASDTISLPDGSKAKPNGVCAAEGWTSGPAATPSAPTT